MPNETPLDDARSVSDHRIESDAVLAISFKSAGAESVPISHTPCTLF